MFREAFAMSLRRVLAVLLMVGFWITCGNSANAQFGADALNYLKEKATEYRQRQPNVKSALDLMLRGVDLPSAIENQVLRITTSAQFAEALNCFQEKAIEYRLRQPISFSFREVPLEEVAEKLSAI